MERCFIECSEAIRAVEHTEDLILASEYQRRGYLHAKTDIFLRKRLHARLYQAARMLPEDVRLVALDGHRPLPLQAQLYNEYKELLGKQGFQGAQLEAETLRFVSSPNPDPLAPPPHLTGGAVDVILADQDGVPLDMGGEYDELSERSHSHYYENRQLDESLRVFQDRRRLLAAIMTHVGFSNYVEEWWHFDQGNQWHHARVGGVARYGGVL